MSVNENSAELPSSMTQSGSPAEIPSEVIANQNVSWMQRILPWLVSLSVVVWLLWPYRAPEQRAVLMNAFSQASHWTVPLSVICYLIIWLTDSFATARTLQRWGTPIGFRETALIRGATGLFDVVNPTLGQAVLTLVVYRRGTPLAHAILVVLMMNVAFLVHIALISGVGLLAGGAPESEIMSWLVGLALGSTTIYLTLIALRPAFLAKNATLRWLMDAGLSGHAWAFLYRLPNMAALIIAQVVLLSCFGINLPLYVSLFYLPALLFIVGMPLSVQGLGPGQVAAVSFFSAYVAGDRASAEAAILASGFAGSVLTTAVFVVIGLCCLSTETGRNSVAAIRTAAAARARSS
jgi:hypothetical protein